MPIKKFIEWLGFSRHIHAPADAKETFLLKYNDLLIGTLTVRDGKWVFEYSDQFRHNQVLRPIVEFPDVNKSYESEELWQFFASRIPSTEQSEVEEILRQENIEEDDAVSLLKRFGRRTIANPYELVAAT